MISNHILGLWIVLPTSQDWCPWSFGFAGEIKCEIKCSFCLCWDLFVQMQSSVRFYNSQCRQNRQKTATHLFQTRYSAERTTDNILLMFITIIFLRLKNQNFDYSKCREESFIGMVTLYWEFHTQVRKLKPLRRIRNNHYCYGTVQ